MLRGSAGGATVFLGKCLVGGRSTGGRIIGLPTVALGSAVVANASAGRSAFERLELPLGPIRVVRDNKHHDTWIRLDLATASSIVYFATQPHTSFQWAETFEHGLPVFYGVTRQNDLQATRVLLMSPPANQASFSHEITHAAQSEFITQAWQSPLKNWALGNSPTGNFITRYVDIGVLYPAWALLNHHVDHESRPWENESHFFEGGC